MHKQTQHNMCCTLLFTNKHNTICVGHYYAQTNTTQYMLYTAMHKQTQHNMCWTLLYVNKHNTICVVHYYGFRMYMIYLQLPCLIYVICVCLRIVVSNTYYVVFCLCIAVYNTYCVVFVCA
jgi:hypothetical protein